MGSKREEDSLNPRMKQLQDRQVTMLQKLQSLEDEVKKISVQLGHKYGDSAPVSKATPAVSLPTGPVNLPEGKLDFVISVSAKSPESSFSPLLIGELLKTRGVDVAFPTHIHSNCTNLNTDGLTQYGVLFTGRLNTSTCAKVNFTFIFKDDAFSPNVMYSPLSQTRIIGDVNIARYLCRFLVNDLYDETDVGSVSNIDQWLDTARKITQGSSKEKDASMKTLNAHFGKKHSYVCMERMTLADITLFSAILGSTTSLKALPKNVRPWFERMASSFDQGFIARFNIPAAWLSD